MEELYLTGDNVAPVYGDMEREMDWIVEHFGRLKKRSKGRRVVVQCGKIIGYLNRRDHPSCIGAPGQEPMLIITFL